MRNLIAAAVTAALVAGCASAAKPGAMAIAVSEQTLISEQSGLYKSIATPTVEGGKETSPLWKSNVSSADFAEALRQSLSAATMLTSDKGRFNLTANMVELKQPLVGFDMTVTSRVNYTLTDAASGATVWSKEITTPYTATVSDAFLGVKRLQLANEGAIKANIDDMLKALVAESATNPALAPAAAPVAAWFVDLNAG